MTKNNGLTERQATVAELRRQGLTQQEIAERLGVVRQTVGADCAVIANVVDDNPLVQKARLDTVNLAGKAVSKYRRSLDRDDRDSFAVATNVLKTVGALRERVEIEHNHQVHTAEEFNDRFTNALRLAGQRPEEAEVVEDSDE